MEQIMFYSSHCSDTLRVYVDIPSIKTYFLQPILCSTDKQMIFLYYVYCI